MNPLLHYVMFGRSEGRLITAVAEHVGPPSTGTPVPSSDAAPEPEANREAAHAKLISASNLFDAEWYGRKYQAVGKSGLDPALHYLRHGAALGYAPSPAFHAADYASRHNDVRGTGMNPLVHYLLFGMAEKRAVKPFDADEVQARLVVRSGFYDEQWYLATYPEVAKSKLSPLRHFLKHGREKGHSPGPRFDAEAYVANNADVAAIKINPLIHYLQFGQAEGRAISNVPDRPKPVPPRPRKPAPASREENPRLAAPEVKATPAAVPPATLSTETKPVEDSADLSDDIALIEATPLFDKTWYLSRYPEAGKQGMSAAEHYLRHGEMRQPSIFFDPQYYVIEQSPEIQHTRINPLLHYLKVGKALGRKPRALFEASPQSSPFKPLSPSSWPLIAADAARPETEIAWKRHADLKAVPVGEGIFIDGALIAWSPPGRLSGHSHSRFAVFSAMTGLKPTGGAHQNETENAPGADFDAKGYCSLGHQLTAGSAAVADMWFINDRTLRIRFGNDDEAGGEPLVVRAFHVNPAANSGPVLAGEALVGTGGPEFADFALASPFLPLLLVVTELTGEAKEIGLLPFPSLCRGGHHHAETVGAAALTNPVAQLQHLSDAYVRSYMAGRSRGDRLVASVSVTVATASGAETIFSPDVLGWITSVFNLAVSPALTRQPDTPGESYLRQSLSSAPHAPITAGELATPGQFVLELPPDAIPSIAALTSRSLDVTGDVIAGSWYVADATTGRPRLSVVMPPAGEDLLRLQPSWAPVGYPVLKRVTPEAQSPRHNGQLVHLAIRTPASREGARSAMLMPLAPDSNRPVIDAVARDKTIGIVLRASSIAATETFLRSLVRQQNITLGNVLIECQEAKADADAFKTLAESLIPGRASVVCAHGRTASGTPSVIEPFTTALTLFADDTVVLHDVRTLEVLSALAASERTASASCVLLRESHRGRVRSSVSSRGDTSRLTFLFSLRPASCCRCRIAAALSRT
jgi:hypothetical protein